MLHRLSSESLATFNVIQSVAEQKLLMCSAFVCEHLFAITESLITSRIRDVSVTCQHGCDLQGTSKHAQTQVHSLLP